MLNLQVPKKWFLGEKFISESIRLPYGGSKQFPVFFFVLFFLRLLEIGAIFQA